MKMELLMRNDFALQKNKCAMYWTEIEKVSEKFGSIQVKLKKITSHDCFIHREFELRTVRFICERLSISRDLTWPALNLKVKKTKKVHHYQFTEWPDMDDTEPHDILEFINFVKSNKKAEKQEELWVVHCR